MCIRDSFKSPKRKVLTLRDWGLKRCTACGIGSLRGSIASLAAIGAAIRLASAPIIRCRSADLVLVQPNHRLPIVRILRRAPAMPPWQAMASLYKSEVVGNCVRVTNRRQSDSENRSRPNRIEGLNAATPRAGISIPEASRSFKPETANQSLSLGGPRGIFSHVREWPPFFAPRTVRGTPLPFRAKRKNKTCLAAGSIFRFYSPSSTARRSLTLPSSASSIVWISTSRSRLSVPPRGR